ncbi:LOW QUALITY PROTEIN: hypothetical protein Dda_8780 [Drechslerella dactyloides]|uniref:DUF292-domain-containing protein n=1 Tax=Drechslerella dactyloides TaxID=74499 RepID=A0AAD6NH07_DREDA|nr:LOW QUALITY PROTEIN: hypothetical protein Dda_8780 [Drechslerella dactyloides]
MCIIAGWLKLTGKGRGQRAFEHMLPQPAFQRYAPVRRAVSRKVNPATAASRHLAAALAALDLGAGSSEAVAASSAGWDELMAMISWCSGKLTRLATNVLCLGLCPLARSIAIEPPPTAGSPAEQPSETSTPVYTGVNILGCRKDISERHLDGISRDVNVCRNARHPANPASTSIHDDDDDRPLNLSFRCQIIVLAIFIVGFALLRVMAPPSPLLSKLKVSLKLSISRLRMVQQKETALAKINRRQLAQLIEAGKIESARIRVEIIIREDINVELLEVLELYCELLLARIGLMEAKDVDPGLDEAVQSIIYAAPRTDVKELQQVRVLLVEKYGKAYAAAAIDNTEGKVAERVTKKLKVEPPGKELVELYLQEIAKAYHVHYPGVEEEVTVEDAGDDDDDGEGGGGGVPVALLEEPLAVAEEELSHATPPRKINLGPKSPIAIAPASPTTENVRPQVKLPDRTEPKTAAAAPGPSSSAKSSAGPPVTPVKRVVQAAPRKAPGSEIDQDLLKRFAALKSPPKD